jgi:cobalt-zinc-cadmium efflux system outer membrane protein
LLARAQEHRPDLVGARLAREKAEAVIRSSQRLRFPDLSLSAGVSGQGSGDTAVNPPTVSVGLSITPPVFNTFAGEITKAKAEALAAQASEARLQARILAEVFSAYAQWSKSRKRVERAQAGLLDRAGRTRDLVRLQYQKGAASLLEYLDAERTLIATQLSYTTDLADYWRAVVLLGQAIGEDFLP